MKATYKVISVSPAFEISLKKKHKEFNKDVSQKYYKKSISLVGFTEMIAPCMMNLDVLNHPRKKEKRIQEIQI